MQVDRCLVWRIKEPLGVPYLLIEPLVCVFEVKKLKVTQQKVCTKEKDVKRQENRIRSDFSPMLRNSKRKVRLMHQSFERSFSGDHKA